jgi:phosphoglycolate phosphatase-like HAD superfamily hydrolase
MPAAAIFDIDGTLVDSVDLHAIAWQEALVKFGHHVTFEQARSQIGKGGDQLIPMFLSEAEQKDHGKEMEEWRGKLFKSKYLPLVRPFSAVPELLRRVREAGFTPEGLAMTNDDESRNPKYQAKFAIQFIQHEIRKQWRERAALRGPLPTDLAEARELLAGRGLMLAS